jgi:hypothetical protein
MSGVFQNIAPPPPPPRPASVYPPAFGAGEGHTRWAERGWGVNILEDARHSSVLYICKYFVIHILPEVTSYLYFPFCGTKVYVELSNQKIRCRF